MDSERDLESMARARLSHTIASVVKRIRDTADQIEREAARNLVNAYARTHEFSTYSYAVGSVADNLATMTANIHLSTLIEAAASADQARLEKSGEGR